MNLKVLNYVKKELAYGKSEREVVAELRNAGVPKKEIIDAFRQIQDEGLISSNRLNYRKRGWDARKCIKYGAVLFLLLILVGGFFLYDFYQSSMEDIKKARFFIDRFYQNMNIGLYEETLPMFHEKWFEVTPRDKTVELFRKINERLGRVEEKSLADYNLQKYAGAMTHIILVYDVKRTKYPSREVFTICYEEGSENFRIMGYQVNSVGFIE